MADIDPENQETGFEDLNFVTNIDQGDKLAYYRIFYELLPRFGFNVSFHSGAHDSAGSLLPGMERVLVKKDQSWKLAGLAEALDKTPEGKLLWQVTDRNHGSLDGLLFGNKHDAAIGSVDKKWVSNNRGFIESCLKTALLRRAEMARSENQVADEKSYEAAASQLEEDVLTKERIKKVIENKLLDLLRDNPDLRP